MSRVINTYWVDERIRAQRVAPRASSPFAAVREISLDIIGTPAEVRRRGGVIPAWVIFGMIILARLRFAWQSPCAREPECLWRREQYVRMQTDVEGLRNANQSLRVEIEQLRN